MTRMTGPEVLEALTEILEEHEVNTRQFAWDDLEDAVRDEIVADLGEYECMQEPLRTEGSGDFDGAQAVYHFISHDVYISVEGYYVSDDGMTFEDFDVVEPQEVTTTIYVSKK